MDTFSFVAFLRGINVGGNKKVDMAGLRKAFESLECHGVQTLLNSGNVVFESDERDIALLTKRIEQRLEEMFGFSVPVIIRLHSEICELVLEDPFKHISVTSDTRLYVTFLSNEPKKTLHIPYETPEKDFRILRVTHGVVLSVLTVSQKRGTTDVMKILETEFGSPRFSEAGKKITTRNWNTVVKIASLHEETV